MESSKSPPGPIICVAPAGQTVSTVNKTTCTSQHILRRSEKVLEHTSPLLRRSRALSTYPTVFLVGSAQCGLHT